jgi:ATP-dependent HslUV protease ATP-binding subunit HslU
MEKLLEDISFQAPDMAGVTIEVTPAMVRDRLHDIVISEDLSRFIL